jgi:hypothetical protein
VSAVSLRTYRVAGNRYQERSYDQKREVETDE